MNFRFVFITFSIKRDDDLPALSKPDRPDAIRIGETREFEGRQIAENTGSKICMHWSSVYLQTNYPGFSNPAGAVKLRSSSFF
jgi:hypothetical protein